eukprot:CAMPEP_0114671348 /NCGR_PEP_ID=MMETSP0191-20121206/41021_1 /TAXON_ID=126664 /ORGANISM="Sorites sp." /LENGTH=149 /DNA_ID=CAMNT_0001931007 /DNA_START=485 /DNA_END=934 /DNA_ORIENTATION=+
MVVDEPAVEDVYNLLSLPGVGAKLPLDNKISYVLLFGVLSLILIMENAASLGSNDSAISANGLYCDVPLKNAMVDAELVGKSWTSNDITNEPSLLILIGIGVYGYGELLPKLGSVPYLLPGTDVNICVPDGGVVPVNEVALINASFLPT